MIYVSLYISIGIFFAMMVIKYPYHYQEILSDSLKKIKLFQSKLKNKKITKEEEEKIVQEYEETLMNKIKDAQVEHTLNPNKGVASLLLLVIMYPFILYLLLLAYLIDIFSD